MPALYRTYRPKRFSEVIGQQHIVKTLHNAVLKDQPAHAYLFCGGRGLGKTTLARVLARALNCLESKKGEACLVCRVCKEMDAGSFLDLLEVDAASNTGVDNVRALIETVRFQPTSGKYKIYIIDEAHMLSKGAWNALLKTLEEPPARTVFVMATTESAKVPATINSRAQRFDFGKFSEQQLREQIGSVLVQEKQSLSPDVVALLARTASGGMRDALTLLDQVLSLGESPSLDDVYGVLGVTSKEVLLELLQLLRAGNVAELPTYFAKLTSQYFDMLAVNRDLLELLRELLTRVLSPRNSLDEAPELVASTGWFTEQELLYLIRQFLRSYKETSSTPDPGLPLFIASAEAALKLSGRDKGVAEVSPPPAPAVKRPVVVSAPEAAAPVVQKSAEAAPVAEPVSVASSDVVHGSAPALDETKVRELWPEVCSELKEINGPLATLVRNSPIVSVQGAIISLGVKYLFHKEQLESTKSKQILSQCVEKVLGTPGRVVAQFVEREEQVTSPAEVISDALKIFGGELVE